MNWQWLIDQGLISGEANYYSSGDAAPSEYSNAITKAYEAADETQRKELIDMLWSTGTFGGNKEYWYADKTGEVADLAAAAAGMGTTGQELLNVGGKPQVWKVGGKTYLVYEEMGVDGVPIRMSWLAPSDSDVQAFFGPGQTIVYNQTLDAMPPDVMDFGTTDELANLTGDPVTAWKSTLEEQSRIQPWLLDPDYQALSLMAVLEGRALTTEELYRTEFYKNNNPAQRQWLITFNSDPLAAQTFIDDQRINTTNMLEAAGVSNPSDEMINYLSDQLTMGNWSSTYFSNQLEAISDPASGIVVDSGISDILGDTTLETTKGMEAEVRNAVQKWLGPNFGSWDDATVTEWAGKLRNDANAMYDLEEALKDQKEALFSGYNRELSYEAIASPWRQFMSNQWGTTPDDTDPFFQSIINLNDSAEAGKLLTQEGLARGNKTVMAKMQADLVNTFGGSVR